MSTLSGAVTLKGTTMVPAPRWDADEAVTEMYTAHYRSMVRLAALLVRNSGEAEEIVQDAFVALHRRWGRLREPERALSYLRRSVVNGARSTQRHHAVADRHLVAHASLPHEDAPSAEFVAMSAGERANVLQALGGLSQRQQEVLILRYYTDLSEHDIAETLGISRGAVKSHASRGLRTLRSTLEDIR